MRGGVRPARCAAAQAKLVAKRTAKAAGSPGRTHLHTSNLRLLAAKSSSLRLRLLAAKIVCNLRLLAAESPCLAAESALPAAKGTRLRIEAAGLTAKSSLLAAEGSRLAAEGPLLAAKGGSKAATNRLLPSIRLEATQAAARLLGGKRLLRGKRSLLLLLPGVAPKQAPCTAQKITKQVATASGRRSGRRRTSRCTTTAEAAEQVWHSKKVPLRLRGALLRNGWQPYLGLRVASRSGSLPTSHGAHRTAQT